MPGKNRGTGGRIASGWRRRLRLWLAVVALALVAPLPGATVLFLGINWWLNATWMPYHPYCTGSSSLQIAEPLTPEATRLLIKYLRIHHPEPIRIVGNRIYARPNIWMGWGDVLTKATGLAGEELLALHGNPEGAPPGGFCRSWGTYGTYSRATVAYEVTYPLDGPPLMIAELFYVDVWRNNPAIFKRDNGKEPTVYDEVRQSALEASRYLLRALDRDKAPCR